MLIPHTHEELEITLPKAVLNCVINNPITQQNDLLLLYHHHYHHHSNSNDNNLLLADIITAVRFCNNLNRNFVQLKVSQ